MLPASTQKVFTALLAKSVLPVDFTFQTAFLTQSEVEKGVLKGDLIARFTGDPTLTNIQLQQLITALKKQGINRIEGNLVLDTSVFTSHDKAGGWVWNDLPICFSAPAAAVNIDHNCFYVNLDANKNAGDLMTIDVPTAYPINVTSTAYVANKNEAGYCQLDAVLNDSNHYLVKGCLARQEKPFGLSFAVQDPTQYGADIIKNHLKRTGIELNGEIRISEKSLKGRVLSEHFSEPLSVLLRKMMKKSDNQIADSVFRTVAHYQHQRPATFQLASQTLKSVLHTKAGIEFGHSVISDGSGLSRHNHINAVTMLQALEAISQNEAELGLLDTFPIAGVDGTLSGRGSMTEAPLVQNIMAKTGALKGVYNLAGFMKNAKGERIAFVQFINGYYTGDLENKTKRAPLRQFEHSLYMELYNDLDSK